MDFNSYESYNPATLFKNERWMICFAAIESRMDNDFFQQIDNVKDLFRVPSHDLLDEEVLICECFCVNVRDIRETCSASQTVDLQVLQEKLSLGHGCRTCIKNVEFWKDKIF